MQTNKRGITMKPTAISYLDYCVNPVIGCTKCSEGCLNCWAWEWAKHWKRDFSAVKVDYKKMLGLAKAKFSTDNLKRGAGSKPLVGVCFLSDLFHPDVPAEFIVSLFEVMAYRKDVDWVILTKRPERMVSVLFGEEGNWYLGGGDFYDHIWIGVTAESQARADERVPILLDHWAGPKFVSVEPQLESIDLGWYLTEHRDYVSREMALDVGEPDREGQPSGVYTPALDWVVCGGESGVNRREFRKCWAVGLYEQCMAAGVPMFFKQGSSQFPGGDDLLSLYGQVHQWPVSR